MKPRCHLYLVDTTGTTSRSCALTRSRSSKARPRTRGKGSPCPRGSQSQASIPRGRRKPTSGWVKSCAVHAGVPSPRALSGRVCAVFVRLAVLTPNINVRGTSCCWARTLVRMTNSECIDAAVFFFASFALSLSSLYIPPCSPAGLPQSSATTSLKPS